MISQFVNKLREREREKAGKRSTSHLYLQIVCNLINNHNYPNLLLSSSQIFCTMRERERERKKLLPDLEYYSRFVSAAAERT